MIVSIDTRQITDLLSFHKLFAKTFGFFSGYGNNMDAWIDCMSGLDDRIDVRLSEIGCAVGEVVVLNLEHVADFSMRQELIFQEFLACVAFVNWRRIERGGEAILALSY